MLREYYKVAMISGGKDSSAMAILLVEKGYKIDEWIFCDTGMEFPDMYKHLDKLEKYLNIKITRLKSENSFIYYMKEHIISKGKRKGEKGYSWPDFRNRWCNTALKKEVTRKYLKNHQHIKEFHGIAIDEAMRAEKNKNKIIRYPLLYWGMTEADCLQLCYDRGFDWDGLYKKFSRVSCWCCPLKRMEDFETLYLDYPELWKELCEMDKKEWRSFFA